MDTLLADLRYALRTLARSPGLTVAAVVTLALGIGANATMFGIVDRLFFQAPPYVRDPGSVVRLYVTQDRPPFGLRTNTVTPYPKYADLRDHARGFASLAAYGPVTMSLGRGTDAQKVRASAVTASFFPLLGVRPALGRFFSTDEDRESGGEHVVVLTHDFWRRHFAADSSVIGRTIPLGKNVYTVVGVAPVRFTGAGFEPVDVWVPVSAAPSEGASPLACSGCYWLTTLGRLRPGVTAAQAASEATAIYRSGSAAAPGDSAGTVILGPIQEARGPNASANARLSLWLGVVAAIVLLIACANVANLLLARAVQRQREVAIRLALGAGRARLVRQLLTESLLLSALGGGAAVLLTLWSGPVLAAYLLPFGTAAANDLRALVFIAAVVLLTGMLVGVIPAAQASAPDLTAALKSGVREGTFRRSRTRAVLLVSQVALTLVLLVGAGLFIRSLRNVAAIPLGFDADCLLSASVDLRQLGYKNPGINGLYERMRERVVRLQGVAGASVAVGSPFAVSLAIDLEVPGVADSVLQSKEGGPYIQVVSPDYFATLGTAVRRGRGFTPADGPGAPRVTVVNETMAHRLWPAEDPLTKCLKIGVKEFRKKIVPCSAVVGVVEDVRRNQLTEGPTMQYYVPLDQTDSTFFLPVTALLVRTVGPSDAMVAPVRREIQAVSADLPFANVQPIKQLFDWQLKPWRLGAAVLTLFGALALVLAAVGLYGVLAYVVTQRTQELGVRIALGAARHDVLALVVRQGLLVAEIGIVLGAGAALLSGRVVASLLYGISPTNVAVLGGAAGVLFAVAFVASYLPARRATRVDPMVALRYE